MTNNKLAIALIVLFITISGFSIGLMGFKCASPTAMQKEQRQEYREEFGQDPYGWDNVSSTQCMGLPFWSGYHLQHILRSEIRNAALGIFIATLILDGLVIGAYKIFGRERPTEDLSKKTDE